jgi:hypothetical protein
MSTLRTALDQIVFARGYTLRLLEGFNPAEWFRMPAEGVTHVAWQVGHLAMAEYLLALDRIRGVRPGDDDLISPEFLRMFRRESRPDPDPSRHPSPEEMRAVLDRVHEQVLREVPQLPEAEWAAPPLKPHSLAVTKLEVLFWCGHHEMLHAGQIGLLRRLLGYAPQW